MTVEERYSIWAPENSVWSPWVAPVLFAQLDCAGEEYTGKLELPVLDWFNLNDGKTALVVDLPGASSVAYGVALARKGVRPVVVVNASPGPHLVLRLTGMPTTFPNTAVNMGPLVDAVCEATSLVRNLQPPADAPPAFLLDSERLGSRATINDKVFDNRWMVFPQDFPSARFLKEKGIERVLLIQQQESDPLEDLAHVLLRWQEGGITILAKPASDDRAPCEITVRRPWRFKAAWYRALAIMGLRRNSAGGFGSYIPETTGLG